MARKPNYDFEKRKKEAARQKRKAEKRERRRAEKNDADAAGAREGAETRDQGETSADTSSAGSHPTTI